MAREICKLNLVVVDDGDETTATGSVTLDGKGSDLVNVFEHIFEAFDLDPLEAYICSMEAVKQMKARKDEEE